MSRVASALWRDGPHVFLRVRVTPKASRDGIEGMVETADGPALKVRVRAVPEDGAANTAVGHVVAAEFGIPKSAVDLIAGEKSRVKTLSLAGDPDQLVSTFNQRIANR